MLCEPHVFQVVTMLVPAYVFLLHVFSSIRLSGTGENGHCSFIFKQCFGSGFIESGSGSVSRSRVLMTKDWKKFNLKKKFDIVLIKNWNLHTYPPPKRRSKLQEKPSALEDNIHYFTTWNFLLFYFCWSFLLSYVRIRIPDPKHCFYELASCASTQILCVKLLLIFFFGRLKPAVESVKKLDRILN